jgi:hypothetical protein
MGQVRSKLIGQRDVAYWPDTADLGRAATRRLSGVLRL